MMENKNLKHANIIGYFKESGVDVNTSNKKLLYFVAFENSNKDKKWIEGYNIIDGHFVLRDEKYLISCKRITKEEYLNATKGYYTPEEYLA